MQGGGARPVLGMLVFAAGLALPFFLLAIFPQYLKKMPRSGGWLARVKVVMGFIVLAAMFKYLAAIDQVMQWNAVTRERFLAIWVVLFAMTGLYLLGFLPLEGVKRDDKIGMGRLLTGMAFLAFALSSDSRYVRQPSGRTGDVRSAGHWRQRIRGGGGETALWCG